MTLKDTNEIFADDLRDPEYAAGYLNIAMEDDGVEGFLYALQKVARAHGIRDVAAHTGIPRESLYRSLSERGNPGIKPLSRVMESVGLRLTVSPCVEEITMPQEVSGDQTKSDLHQAMVQEISTLREELKAHLTEQVEKVISGHRVEHGQQTLE